MGERLFITCPRCENYALETNGRKGRTCKNPQCNLEFSRHEASLVCRHPGCKAKATALYETLYGFRTFCDEHAEPIAIKTPFRKLRRYASSQKGKPTPRPRKGMVVWKQKY